MDIDAAPAAPAAAAADAAAPADANVDYQMLYQRGREVFESMQQKGGPAVATFEVRGSALSCCSLQPSASLSVSASQIRNGPLMKPLLTMSPGMSAAKA